jgi:hypothetical protein
MTASRILLIAAVVCFAITALSAFSDDINVNELGWLALGLAAWAGSSLAVGVTFGAGAGAGRRRRLLR